eukprot:m.125398 g.125398  ORF g.125398 m.125398 type:complete len:55 (+) comp16651_c0_seq5:1978-2142(+)
MFRWQESICVETVILFCFFVFIVAGCAADGASSLYNCGLVINYKAAGTSFLWWN